MAIPPIVHTLKKLTSVFTARIQRLPPFSLICSITLHNPAADWHLSTNPETALTRLLPSSFPLFFFPSHPSSHFWTHPWVRDNTAIKLSHKSKEATKSLITNIPYDTFHLFVRILTIPSPPFTAAFLLFQGPNLVLSGSSWDSSQPGALLSALCQGLMYTPLSNHVHIFLPDLSLSNYLFHTSKHAHLPHSLSFIHHITNFLSSDSVHHVDLYRYSVKWSGLPGTATLESLSEVEQCATFPLPPTPLLPPKARLLRDLEADYYRLDHSAHVWQSIIPPDGKPPPFYIGALSCKDRRTSSSAVQLAFDHAFTATYSDWACPTAGDNTLCPCGASPSPTLSFEQLIAIQNKAPRLTLSPSPRSSRAPLPRYQRPRPRYRPHNTTHHVLFQCPLHTSPCHHIFGTHPFDAFIFGTEDGGRKLGAFQCTTNTLLRPLPPRPDPP